MKANISTGLSVIYFNNDSKNIYAQLPTDKEYAKRLSRRVFKDAMTALSAEKQATGQLVVTLFPNN